VPQKARTVRVFTCCCAEFEHDDGSWHPLLSVCDGHGDDELDERCREELAVIPRGWAFQEDGRGN